MLIMMDGTGQAFRYGFAVVSPYQRRFSMLVAGLMKAWPSML